MNPTPELHQRYLSGLPTQSNYSAHEPARPKSAMPTLLLTVVGVVGLMLLVFYVALIRPLVKKSQQLTTKNTVDPKTAEEQKEEKTEEDKKEEPKTTEEPEESEESPDGGSPRR